MPVVNRIADFSADMTAWRRHLHTIPELGLECHQTAAFVAERLREFGVDEIVEGVAKTGIVAIINGQGTGPTIGLRADMDALPITEETGVPYASTHAGKMHACGHDGHTAMLLGAAKYLAETRNFAGRVALLFQPAEEFGGGGEVMVQEGVMERFDITQVYAIHNAPGLDFGRFHTTPGPIMAAADTFTINLTGKGGHGAQPHECVDPVVAACAIVQSLQTIVSRNTDPLSQLVISTTQIHTGTTDNVIPGEVYINGTVRTFDKEVQAMAVRRMQAIVDGHAASYDLQAELDFEFGYPPTVNDAAKTDFAIDVAGEVAGEAGVEAAFSPVMGAEDFSYMLEARPGAYLMLGQGEGASVHHAKYNFNDDIAPIGASFFARLVERAQPVGGA
ncbi:amidohydrolase [Sulfitobacter sp. M57]|uniref:M20 aminoacylase family protein n=1 Tax=unclassified Sulfitobacter TaxID=196795 RepID=UPI0023E11D3D|nr:MULTISPECIES: M20 aminoacylase family protein [unclassified Sulfitobacter]MDF3413899.1 amidohydrolase [Sulfitobacter sp. KE5]MDF3420820.1 amidohydrolase [Sulfitobacter sp. KE43]MDF3432445.1 amidohydrolase [Sulfitobacter sp. KE42]MDF3458084.1 amidohydrolase [Sulfitobacter sp. S74]MDF3461985.1 amidohydrolase [Sulfitobacter sp. Ks18]